MWQVGVAGAEQPAATRAVHYSQPSESDHHPMDHYAGPGRPSHEHANAEHGPEMGAYPAEARGGYPGDGKGGMNRAMNSNMHSNMHPNILYNMPPPGQGHRDYTKIREPWFSPHGGMHPGMAQIPRPVHTGHLGNYGPSQYLDHAMMDEYSHKMQMLQHDFDVMLRPKLDALRRQVVTVEERIREVSLTKDELLEEAVLDHRALLEQINLSSERRLSALSLDLEQLMRDVALIHDLIQQLAPAQQGPKTPTAVWYIHAYMYLYLYLYIDR
jgi:hypothetical protein